MSLQIRSLTKIYPGGVTALRGLIWTSRQECSGC